jgi:serine/threonine protein kinase
MQSIKERRDDVPLAKPDVRASRFHFTHDGERNAMVIPGLRYVASLNANPDSHVFAAERLTDGRRVVVKVPTQSPYYESAQLHQIGARWQFLSKLDTRYVVRYLDAGIAGAWIFGVMEYLSGGDLRARIRAGLNGVQSVRLLFRLASALESIHRHGYAHMDIKPENIFFRESITSTTGSEEARNAPVLIDFNLSTRFGEVVKHPVSQDILGTPLYMSPEQAQGLPIAATSDLYSLGVVFFEMLTGETPFPVESATQTMFRHIYDEIPLLPKRVREYQPLIDRLLAKDPRERFQSGAELASALSPFLMESAS